MTPKPTFRLRLFYSYSHKDQQHRTRMEDALALLRDQDGVLKEWSDRQILPGQEISKKIQEQLKKADILVFLISSNFISSGECRKEWARAGELVKERPSVVRVPIILGACDWKTLDGMSGLKALPNDGRPVKAFSDRDIAWQQVCDGLRALINSLRENFTIKTEFQPIKWNRRNLFRQVMCGCRKSLCFHDSLRTPKPRRRIA